ncbi:MAG: hypothetical protein OPY06_06130 [Nitrosopumilus sp.]|nr:hypothetical protein [Nitrosopumilus sp.]MDF2423548.1 hypothetical protein [Nitrosopumilus sp.]MDF2424593.1 hypothetical protein [Nitrosopumilus sp.]MDF2425043.1 hypothetical protein [Nitrosopumilus sp.]MDF2427485.1 hypothetical protein [Nitrosopumilus sp.]
MGFTKICPMCGQTYLSLVTYMSHIKNRHSKESPESFVKEGGELKWTFRSDD